MQSHSLSAEAREAPALPWLLLEPQRAFWEILLLLPSLPVLALAPRGDGHPVVVLPGFMADDASTVALREFLSRCGYEVEGWGFGRNLETRVEGHGGGHHELAQGPEEIHAVDVERAENIGERRDGVGRGGGRWRRALFPARSGSRGGGVLGRAPDSRGDEGGARLPLRGVLRGEDGPK